METFAERYTNQIRGVISCFDRVNGHNWLARQLDKLARPVRNAGRSYRGFNLFYGIDLELFLALARGEHTISGLRNRDVRQHLGLSSSQVSRTLKRLRLHGLLKKVARRHKYYLTALGRRAIACCLRMREEAVLPTLALQQ